MRVFIAVLYKMLRNTKYYTQLKCKSGPNEKLRITNRQGPLQECRKEGLSEEIPGLVLILVFPCMIALWTITIHSGFKIPLF